MALPNIVTAGADHRFEGNQLKLDQSLYFVVYSAHEAHEQHTPGRLPFWHVACHHPCSSILRNVSRVGGLETHGVVKICAPTLNSPLSAGPLGSHRFSAARYSPAVAVLWTRAYAVTCPTASQQAPQVLHKLYHPRVVAPPHLALDPAACLVLAKPALGFPPCPPAFPFHFAPAIPPSHSDVVLPRLPSRCMLWPQRDPTSTLQCWGTRVSAYMSAMPWMARTG